jgi:glycerol-3-phosphate acyltransferase PlsY
VFKGQNAMLDFNVVIDIVAIVIAYLLGSVSSAIIVCKVARAPDPRSQGSGNPGATNVLRVAGKKLAIMTLAGDVLKGVLAVMIARILGLSEYPLALVGLAAFLGHLYPLYFKFKGGKGVATGVGVLFTLSPLLGVVATITWLIIVKIWPYVSLASLVTAVLVPFYALLLQEPAYFIPLVVMALFIMWRHRGNIDRLRTGTESILKLRK